MNIEVHTKAEKTLFVKRTDVFNEFVLWSAMPYSERVKLGVETQSEFAEFYKVNKTTLSRWKQRPDFESHVDKILRIWAMEKTPDVIQGIYKAAVRGNPYSQTLWLQYFKGFNPKAKEEEGPKRVEYGVNDIRFLIEALPEPLRTKHHANLRELIEDGMRLRHAGQLENLERPADRPEDAVRGEADNDAQDVSSEGADEVACRHTPSVCANMERTASTYHHQGASRWGEEQAPRHRRVRPMVP